METRVVMVSMRIPEAALDCWLKHFFAAVERVKEDDNGDRSPS
ncbi:hypothetical protein LCGC14_2035870 [marine sediment metagenome]|uniref:Uncharacterized protein n=1 Tax=marine sediment metagenome TaxID=412755 RepID=A0A0F9ETK2_9ZZZZ